MRKLITFLMALAIAFSMGITAFAAGGTVTYNSKANEFIFEPGSDESPTDLFNEDFKGVMPGDSITEQIEILNPTSKKVKIKVYMRSKGAQDGTDEFLNQMELSVKQNGKSILFDAPAGETAQLTDWNYLGTIYSGGEITLDVTLNVPIEMGNDFQNQIGYFDWEFKIEELPVEESDPSAPKTGDTIMAAVIVMVVALVALVIIFFLVKRKKKSDDK